MGRRGFFPCLLSSVFYLLPSAAWPAACTLGTSYNSLALSAGHWTGTGCTGGGFVPGNGDTAAINAGVTLKLANGETWIIGSSPAINSTAAVSATTTGAVEAGGGAVLRLRGDFTWTGFSTAASALIMDAGSTLIFDSSQASSPATTRYRYGQSTGSAGSYRMFTANGTSASHAIVTSCATGNETYCVGGAAHGALPGQFRASLVGQNSETYGGNVTAAYTDFSYIGDGTTYGHAFEFGWYSTNPEPVSITHCTFDHTGAWRQMATMTASTPFNLDYNVYTNSLGTTNAIVAATTTMTTGPRSVTYNVFDKRFADGDGGCNGELGLANFTFTGNYFGAGICGYGATSSAAPTTTDNFFRLPPPAASEQRIWGNLTGGYVFVDEIGEADMKTFANSANMTTTYSGFVVDIPEDTATQTGAMWVPQANLTVQNTILVPSKTGHATLSYGTSVPAGSGYNTLFHLHNTWSGGLPGSGWGALSTNESGAAGSPYGSLKSTLLWSATGAHYCKVGIESLTLLQNSVVAADYNSMDQYGLANAVTTGCTQVCSMSTCPNQGKGYIGSWTVTPGAHDVLANPYFVDYLRAMPLWDSRYLGHTAANGAWSAGQSYTVGQVYSDATAGVYGGAPINYRAIAAHTSSAQNEPTSGMYKTSDSTLTSITTDASKNVTVNFASNPGLYVGAPVGVVESTDGLWGGYVVASIASNSVVLSPACQNNCAASHTYNDAGLTVGTRSAFWEYASLYDMRAAIAAGTTYTDGAIGCAGCTAIQALVKWVQKGFTPQNPALWCAGHDGETIGAVPFCASGKVMIGILAGM